MRASLIFSSTSHSINVQKVFGLRACRIYLLLIQQPDLQDRLVKSF